MPKSFAELEEAERVEVKELIETLESYVSSGAAISGSVVVSLIESAKPNKAERQRILDLARSGRNEQNRLHNSKDARDYQQVISFLNR